MAGFSCRRRREYAYHCSPNGTYTRSRCPSATSSRARSSRTPSNIWSSGTFRFSASPMSRSSCLAIETQRRVGGRRVLHVDAHEASLREHLEHVFPAQLVRELEAERGELDADVRVQALALDRVEHLEVRTRDRLCIVGVSGLFPE